MYKLTDDNFNNFISKVNTESLLSISQTSREVLFCKNKNSIIIANEYFIIVFDNIKIDIQISEEKPVFDLISNEWIAYKKEKFNFVSKFLRDLINIKFTYKLLYDANKILEILNKEPEKIQNRQSKCVFGKYDESKECDEFTFKINAVDSTSESYQEAPLTCIESIMLHSVLPIFSLCNTSEIFISFQEKIATARANKYENVVMLESEYADKDNDLDIFIFMPCLL